MASAAYYQAAGGTGKFVKTPQEFAIRVTELVYYSLPAPSPQDFATLLYSACYGAKPFR